MVHGLKSSTKTSGTPVFSHRDPNLRLKYLQEESQRRIELWEGLEFDYPEFTGRLSGWKKGECGIHTKP